MKIRHRRSLSEAASDWINDADIANMTDEEEYWHKKMTAMLLNKKGKWGPYQHALYALRFQDYILKIVPRSVDPKFTACVVFEQAVVYIGEGFLVDEEKYYQLNVIIRHELAHILLRHEIRMMAKIGELPYSRIGTNQSLHRLINIIADFEISNRKYTSEDKNTVLNMYLNGELIKGLVTEMHREDWMKLPIEEMYDKLTVELDKIASDISEVGGLENVPSWSDLGGRMRKEDEITLRGISTMRPYLDSKEPSVIWNPIDEYFKTSKQFAKFNPEMQESIKAMYEAVKDYSEAELEELLTAICSSGAFAAVQLDDELDVITPAEKYWANQVIKNLLGNARPKPTTTIKRALHSKEYKDAYNKIIRKCGRIADCSDEELAEILGSLGAAADFDTDGE
jgi:hypothetical protein